MFQLDTVFLQDIHNFVFKIALFVKASFCGKWISVFWSHSVRQNVTFSKCVLSQFGTKLSITINQSCSVCALNLFFLSHQQGPDYRLYKSEPELTTVTEVDENNGEDRSEHPSEHSGNKGTFE